MYRKRSQKGFTLMEAALTTVIVGVGVLAIVESQQAYMVQNNWASRSGTGQALANEVRELMMSLPFDDPLTGSVYVGPEPNEAIDIADFDDVDDFSGEGDGMTFNPPINAMGVAMDDLTQWSQIVTVESVLDSNMGGSAQVLGATDLLRVVVRVDYQQDEDSEAEVITQMSWIVKR